MKLERFKTIIWPASEVLLSIETDTVSQDMMKFAKENGAPVDIHEWGVETHRDIQFAKDCDGNVHIKWKNKLKNERRYK